MNYKAPLVLSNPLTKPSQINASIIWLHGLGADGYDFEAVANYLLRSDGLPTARFILPHAPEMPLTRNNGYVMPAWYDIYGITPVSQEDAAGIEVSQQYIDTLIENEISLGIPSDRIVLAGFSQGGAMALHTAVRHPLKLAAIVALSTYLPLQSKLSAVAANANKDIPIFMAHGIFDDVISIEMAKSSRDLLMQHHYHISWHEYNMSHSVSNEEITDIEKFLQRVLD